MLRSSNRDYWDRAAKDNAFFHVASSRADWNVDDFLLDGKWRFAKWVLPWMVRNHPDPARAVFLEIGCGVGRFGYHIAPHVESYLGLDISPGMITQASDLMRDIGNKQFLQGDGVSLTGIPDESADLVFSYAVLQHIYEQDVVLNYVRETVRVLRKCGSAKMQMLGANGTPGLNVHWIHPEDVSEFGVLRKQAVRAVKKLGISESVAISRTSPVRKRIKNFLGALPPDFLLPTVRYYRPGVGMRGTGIPFRDAERLVRHLGCDAWIEPFETEPLAQRYWLHIRKAEAAVTASAAGMALGAAQRAN